MSSGGERREHRRGAVHGDGREHERRAVEARLFGARMCLRAIWRRIGRRARSRLADGFTLRDAVLRIESLP